MYKKILVPLDGSELAEAIFGYARCIALSLKGTDVHLLHIYGAEESKLTPMHQAYIERAVDTISHPPQEATKEASSTAGFEVQGRLAAGKPAEQIIKYAENNGIDLIMMATHGRSGINRWAMGSVAYKVLRSAKVPVWLVRDGIEEEIIEDLQPGRRILVPLDGSKKAEAVLPYVERLAQQWRDKPTEIVLLRAYQPPSASSDYLSDLPLNWEENTELEAAKCKLVVGPYLNEVEKRLKESGLEVRQEAPLGDPAEEIIKYARSHHVSLITMITHGRSGLSRWAYGSVAEEVMLGAYTPVLLVRSH